MGTNSAAVFWASGSLIALIVLTINSQPGNANVKQQRLENELTSQRALGHYFGKQFSLLARGESQALIVNKQQTETG